MLHKNMLAAVFDSTLVKHLKQLRFHNLLHLSLLL